MVFMIKFNVIRFRFSSIILTRNLRLSHVFFDALKQPFSKLAAKIGLFVI